jgi:hypothetical protein
MISLKSLENEKRFLTEDEINGILKIISLPFNTLAIVTKIINEDLKKLSRQYLEKVKIYPNIIDEYKEHIKKKFLFSIIEPYTPIGAIASDAIGAQATQQVLNTFHSVGSVKSGGPDGIKENIGISKKRKVFYSTIHFLNESLSFRDVMKLKSKFIGVTILDLLIGNPESKYIDIEQELNDNPFRQGILDEEISKIINGQSYWWYSKINISEIFDNSSNSNSKRKCIRLKFNIQKLYEYNLTLSMIASFLNKYSFEIDLPKEVGKQRKVKKIEILSIESPHLIGYIDIFIKSHYDHDDDYLASILHNNDFDKINIIGIPEIKNFYAISTPLIRLIRDVEETSRFDEKNGKVGMWIYLNDNRFSGIPYFRLIDLLIESKLDIEIPKYNTVENDYIDYTDISFEYCSYKSIPELRKEMIARGYIFGEIKDHIPQFYKFVENGNIKNINCNIKHYTYETIEKGFEVCLNFFDEIIGGNGRNGKNNYVSPKKFKNKSEILTYVESLENRITSKTFVEIFGEKKEVENLKELEDFFKIRQNVFKFISFKVEEKEEKEGKEGKEGKEEIYYNYCMFQLEYIDYKINVNLDYVNSPFITQSLESTLIIHFGIPYNVAKESNLPDLFRNPRFYNVKRIVNPERRILLKSKIFLTNRYDFLGMPNRDKLLKESKMTPIERLFSHISKKTKDENQKYIYAETKGSNLGKLLSNKSVNGRKTYCNNFYQTYEIFGLEATRNLLSFDMINMINNSGYISVGYINLVSDVTTHNGLNPMTSDGISCQKRDFLSMITFDNGAKYVHFAALSGAQESTQSTATCIILGKRFKIGTGGVDIGVDKTKLSILGKKDRISEGFLKLIGTAKSVGDLFLPDGSEESIFIPKIIQGKFKMINWISDNYIKKDLFFYFKQGVNNTKREKLQMYEPYRNLNTSSTDRLLIRVVRR